MSLEKPSLSSQLPLGETEENTSREDPLYKILSAEEDTDWEYAFMGAIRKPSTTTAPFILRGEENSDNLDQESNTKCSKENSPNYAKLNILNPVQDSEPIELKPSESITEIHEFHVPVTTAVKPEGSLTLAEDQGADFSCPAPGLENLWSHEFISAPAGPLGIYKNSPNPYKSAPLHIVEGREDPEDEGICVESPLVGDNPELSPPPKLFQSPIKTTNKLEAKPFEASSQKPEEFFEKCDILKWAIDDQDIGEMPGISHSQPPSNIPATVTSATTKRQQFTKPRATTNCFIQKVKLEVDDIEQHALPLWSPQTTPITRQTIMEDTDDDAPAAPKRKRGRPARDEPRDITPKLPRLPRAQATSDSEYAYVSDSCGMLTDDEVSAMKYRRMRDLNNEASKRCRQTRKEKMDEKETEVTKLTERNHKLKDALTKMETTVLELKMKFLSEIRNPSTKIAMARRQMTGSQLGYDPNIIGSLMDSEEQELPDVHSFWSV
eukprot:GFUD01015316.1.p1 GENE.GFUD01015316.1~~GFUD01015316.1.p1  ORF type:complete len:493 (-),score=123.73 GFUD01015316.1:541-2019(-)